MRYYLAGPMSNIPQFNIPLFDKMARHARSKGYDVLSPAELDNAAVRAACLASPDGKMTPETGGGESWADFLARDVKLIGDQVGGILLMDNWYRSRGARLEAFVGLLSGKQFKRIGDYEDTPEIWSITLDHVRDQLRRNMP